MTRHRRTDAAEAAPASPIVDQPGYHNYFMIGTETLYLSHMPMFTMERHMYQVVLRATLPSDVMQEYEAGRKAGPTVPYNLTNSSDDPYAIPELRSGRRTSFKADVYKDYSNAEAQPVEPPFAKEVPVQIEQVVHLRHFNFEIPRPEHNTYVLFGTGTEAHLTHYIARDPDYQHIVTLAAVPDWLSADQIQGSVELTIGSMLNTPVPCSNPLTEDSYNVTFQGWDVQQFELGLKGATSLWFSTGNLLNANDPCAHASGTP
jgi:hypothetical protein